jgi:hypothetical protein
MKNKKIISLLASTAIATVVSTSAYSQLSITGYVEASYMAGKSERGANDANQNLVTAKQLGNETLIRVATKGKMSNGMDYSVYQEFESDESARMHARGIEIVPTTGLAVGYSFDGAKGSEIARTATPYVTNRHTDVTGLTGIVEPIDVTSGEHFVYADVNNLAGAVSQLSFAYAPNLDSTSVNGSDRIITVTSTNSGYGVGYSITPVAGLTARAGYTKVEQNLKANQDVKMKTLGVSYATGPFAIGAQRYNQEGLKGPTATAAAIAASAFAGTTSGPQAATHEDETTLISATYAVTKELTVGFGYAEQERTRAGVKDTVDAESRLFSIGYNLGPVVLSYDFEKSENVPLTQAGSHVSGRDVDMNKIRVRANF